MSDYNFQADIKKFDPNTTRYHGENALFLADCAKLAYMPEETCRQVMQDQLGFNNFKFFTGKSTQAFIAGNDKMIIVSFRGTEVNLNDFLRDAKLKPEPGPAGNVHRGFHGGLHEVWGDASTNKGMLQFIQQFWDNNQSIWFCGHSLGAALATLAAAEYVLKDNAADAEAVKGIYTIGQPRVGNNEFADAYDQVLVEKTFRFVNNNDVVTRVPLPGIVLKYSHVGQQLYIDSKGKLRDSIPLWKKLWDRFRGIRKGIGHIGLDSLEDHGSEAYVKLIKDNRAVTIS